jgi:hypothetical protein
LTKDMLVNAIADVVIREVSRAAQGQRVVDVQLERPSHEDALDELVPVLAQFGFSYVEATISEWVGKTVDGVIAGAGGGGLLGSGSKNPVVMLAGAVIGAVVGGWVGSEARHIEVEYQARWKRQRGWVLTELPRQQSVASRLEPALV